MADVTNHATTPLVVVRSVIFSLAFYLTTAVFLLAGSWLLLAPRRWAMAGLALHGKTCVALLALICGTRMEVRGAQNIPKSACLIVSKHQSAWETFALIPLFRDPAVVLKDELKWIPFYGWFCVKFEHILVKREKASVALKHMIADAKARVVEQREIVIFPEGTRTVPGAPPDYKPGYVALYEALEIPAVPLALNSGLYWPRRSFMRYPGTIIVECLPALPARLPRAEFRRRLEASLEQSCSELIAEAASSDSPPPIPTQANKDHKNK
ncbi:MAG: 1-acyl-sn-glycerol-3-phosphate acyltransferase [Hyphomicrobium sp.]|nr:MAG: 1-acyl-sn-glycerol-3-phosphate acyltransferase [Hyphomicrobium sp.]